MRTLLLAAAIALVAAPPVTAVELFWNDDAGIHRAGRDEPRTAVLLFDTFDTRGLAVDAVGDRLFWSDVLPIGGPLPGGVIRTGSAHGGPIVNLVRNLTSPAGVALDERRGKVYWTDLGDVANPSAVFAANLDGSDVRRLISGPSLSEIAGIAVDARHDKLYFTFINPLLDSLFAGGIARADLDGSTFEQVVGGLLQPRGIAIDADGSGIYWADPRGLAGAGNGAIAAADLDGQHLRTVLGGLDSPFGVALDLSEQNVYWTDMAAGKIQRTAMSGILPYFQDVVTGLTAPTAIAIVPEPPSGALAAVGALIVACARRRRPARTTRAGAVMPLVPAVRLHRPAGLGPVCRDVRLV